MFYQGYIQPMEVHQFLICRERYFLHYLNGVMNLGLTVAESFVTENKEIANRGRFFCTFFGCFNHFSKKFQ